MSEPENLHDWYELYALGLLEEPERSQIEEALNSGSPEARQRLRQAIENNAMLLAAAPLIDPHPRLRGRILASAGVKPQSRWNWFAIWGAATAALFVTTLYYGSRYTVRTSEIADVRRQLQQTLEQSAKTNAELARARRVLVFLNAPETKVVTFGPKDPKPPRGRVLVHATQGVVLIASNLPQAPAGKIYEMWIIPKTPGAKPIPAGLFQTDDGGNVLHLEQTAVTGDVLVAVTLEPEAGSPQPTTTPLFAAGT